MSSLEERLDFLGLQFPSLLICVLKNRGNEKEIAEYMEDCKKLENDYEKYSQYVHGYWLPWL